MWDDLVEGDKYLVHQYESLPMSEVFIIKLSNTSVYAAVTNPMSDRYFDSGWYKKQAFRNMIVEYMGRV